MVIRSSPLNKPNSIMWHYKCMAGSCKCMAGSCRDQKESQCCIVCRNRKQYQCSVKHEFAMRAHINDWKQWPNLFFHTSHIFLGAVATASVWHASRRDRTSLYTRLATGLIGARKLNTLPTFVAFVDLKKPFDGAVARVMSLWNWWEVPKLHIYTSIPSTLFESMTPSLNQSR